MIKSKIEETEESVLPDDIDKAIDALVDLCKSRDIDIMVHARPKGTDGLSSTGWTNRRFRAEIVMALGNQLGIPEEVLGITLMAALAGHEMKVARVDSEEELESKLEEIVGEADKDEADTPQIH